MNTYSLFSALSCVFDLLIIISCVLFVRAYSQGKAFKVSPNEVGLPSDARIAHPSIIMCSMSYCGAFVCRALLNPLPQAMNFNSWMSLVAFLSAFIVIGINSMRAWRSMR